MAVIDFAERIAIVCDENAVAAGLTTRSGFGCLEIVGVPGDQHQRNISSC
jgi:hypothetical protein